jgi:hypothetical protein
MTKNFGWLDQFLLDREPGRMLSRPSGMKERCRRSQLVRITYKFARKAAARSPTSCGIPGWVGIAIALKMAMAEYAQFH